jgi:hypothetical protein
MSVNVDIKVTVAVPLETVAKILCSSSPDDVYVVTPQVAMAAKQSDCQGSESFSVRDQAKTEHSQQGDHFKCY